MLLASDALRLFERRHYLLGAMAIAAFFSLRRARCAFAMPFTLALLLLPSFDIMICHATLAMLFRCIYAASLLLCCLRFAAALADCYGATRYFAALMFSLFVFSGCR